MFRADPPWIQKADQSVAARAGLEWGTMASGLKGTYGMMDCGDCRTTVYIINDHLIIYFKWVNCVACASHQDTTAISLTGRGAPWP